MSDTEVIAKPKAAPRKPSSQPNTLDMVVQAITELNDRKGASVPAMKSFILERYPTVDPNMLKYRLKKAIEKGMSDDMIVRPKASDQSGSSLSGRFRLNKARMDALEKAKKPKAKPKAEKPMVKKPKTSEKSKKSPKKAAKPEKKTTPKTVKTAKPKEKTTAKPKAAKPTKTAKSPKAKDKTKAKKVVKKTKTPTKKTAAKKS